MIGDASAAWLLGAFLAGIFVGVSLRAAWDLTHGNAQDGHTDRMAENRDERRETVVTRTVVLPRILVALLAVAVVANGALGFMLIAQRAALENGDRQRERLITCIVDYNTQVGEALDERSARAAANTAAQLRLLEDARTSDPAVREAALEAYIKALRESQDSRVENPYPPADLCQENTP